MNRVHFLGIGGSGASAAASIAKAQGYEVSGCDLEPHNEFTTKFKSSQLFQGHSPDHLTHTRHGLSRHAGNTLILAVTPAIYSLDPKNPELLAAKKKRIPVLTWQEFTGKYLQKDKFVIAVAGTHGKTTTTAILAKLLEDTGLDPTVLLGAIVPRWKTNYRAGKGKYFVVEADEFNDNFLFLNPDISVVTNIELDHPEYFKDFEHYKDSFKKFLQSTKQTIIANLSDPGVNQTLSVHPRGVNTIIDYSKKLIDFQLQIPGEFNRWNASATYQVGLILKIDPQTIKKSLATYQGIDRRFEYLGNFRGAKIYTDFGHHPTEIKTTMEAAREKFPKSRIWLIFEPHMFTRTKALFDDFVKVFQEISIDKIVITDIYQSREMDKGLVNSQQLADAINADAINKESTSYISKQELKNKLEIEFRKNDVVFFMGAGDIDKIAKNLVA